MSQRKITRDPITCRQENYELLAQDVCLDEAVWEALACLKDQGIDIGVKATQVLERRQRIKQAIPKPE